MNLVEQLGKLDRFWRQAGCAAIPHLTLTVP
jgi:hypothetical protein